MTSNMFKVLCVLFVLFKRYFFLAFLLLLDRCTRKMDSKCAGKENAGNDSECPASWDSNQEEIDPSGQSIGWHFGKYAYAFTCRRILVRI